MGFSTSTSSVPPTDVSLHKEQSMDAAQGPKLNPWFSMWTQPRSTIRQIVNSDPERFVIGLAMISGVLRGLERARSRSLGDDLPLLAVLGAALVGGALTGIFLFHIYGFLIRWTGRWFGGSASAPEVRAAIAWPNVITAWLLLLWVPQLALFGRELFTTDTPTMDANPSMAQLRSVFLLLEVFLWIWIAVAFLKCLSEVQRYSTWKALANAFVAGLVIVIPIILLVLVTATLSS